MYFRHASYNYEMALSLNTPYRYIIVHNNNNLYYWIISQRFIHFIIYIIFDLTNVYKGRIPCKKFTFQSLSEHLYRLYSCIIINIEGTKLSPFLWPRRYVLRVKTSTLTVFQWMFGILQAFVNNRLQLNEELRLKSRNQDLFKNRRVIARRIESYQSGILHFGSRSTI